MFSKPKKNIARIGVWADILGRMMTWLVDFLSESIIIGMCVRAVFLLTRAGLVKLSGRRGKTDNRQRFSQMPFSTTYTL